MRNATKGMFVVLGAIAVVALVGCAKPPQAEIDAVNEAVENAEIAEAQTYAPDEYEAALEAQRTAIAEVEAQNARFALSRSYDTAAKMLNDAGAAAEAARAAAVSNREAAIEEAELAVESLTARLATVQEDLGALMSCRKKPKGFTQDLELMQGRIEALAGQVAEVSAQVDAERYLAAIEIATATEPELEAVATDLATARTKLGC